MLLRTHRSRLDANGGSLAERGPDTVDDLVETSYGIIKRVQVFSKWIEDFKKSEKRESMKILDYGCGTGATLTQVLGRTGDEILGLDQHKPSIDAAGRKNPLSNVRYDVGELTDLLSRNERFDVIICSEVLEHLREPETYLRGFHRLLNMPGILMLSVPNGCGPFEQLKGVEHRLDELGIDRMFVWLGQSARLVAIWVLERFGREIPPPVLGWLNEESPHVNFFRLPELEAMCRREGFELLETRGRSLVCGPYADFWLNRWPLRLLLPLNNALADWLPLRFCSDWMLFLRKGEGDN